MKKVLIACEYSGKIRDQFIKQGHDAMSCDLLPSESKGPHYQGSVLDILDDTWDLMIAHPPCTYLCNSGVRWLFEQEGRWAKLDEAVEFFLTLKNAPIKQIAIENPIPHKYARKHIGGYTQLIQPWQFGHGETKATCFWLQGLSNLEPTNIVDGRESRIHKMSPSKKRSKHRSETYSGIAKAIAEQWG